VSPGLLTAIITYWQLILKATPTKPFLHDETIPDKMYKDLFQPGFFLFLKRASLTRFQLSSALSLKQLFRAAQIFQAKDLKQQERLINFQLFLPLFLTFLFMIN
jgi:hypothetical protein